MLEEKYFLEQRLKKEELIRTELQEFLGNIYHSCKGLLEDDNNTLALDQVIKNLIQNIGDFAESYKITL